MAKLLSEPRRPAGRRASPFQAVDGAGRPHGRFPTTKRDAIHFCKGDPAELETLRAMVGQGDLIEVAELIFVDAGRGAIEHTIRKKWAEVVAHCYPDGVVTDRTAIEYGPYHGDDPDGPGHVFVCAPEPPRRIELPGLTVSQREGPGPIQGEDVPYMGTWVAGPARRVLVNMVTPDSSAGPAETMGSDAMEAHLDSTMYEYGEEKLKSLVRDAERVAVTLGRDMEYRRMGDIAGSLLSGRQAGALKSPDLVGASGHLVDRKLLGQVDRLASHLTANPAEDVLDTNTSWESRKVSCFVESYFSNHIEGTRFFVERAKEIVFDGKIPPERHEDGHDVLGVYNNLIRQPITQFKDMTPEDFIETLKSDHARAMGERRYLNPGRFKTKRNMGGPAIFTDPNKVHGSLLEGFQIVQSVKNDFARAVTAKCLIVGVHPFNDGNGRACRVAMSRELVVNGLCHIVVPIAFRNDYLNGMRVLTRDDNPDIIVRSLRKCQKISAACSSGDLCESVNLWAASHAFLRDGRHVNFGMPDPTAEIEWRDRVPAPEEYWRAVDHDEQNAGVQGLLGGLDPAPSVKVTVGGAPLG